VFHVFNRAVRRQRLFPKEADYLAFENVMRDALVRQPTRLLSYCLMPTHWHMILWPRHDGELSEFLRWLTVTHTQRWHARHGTAGTGPLYQGRFKSFPIQADNHFLTVCRYVERNALRANLVEHAEEWRWSSLWQREQNRKVDWLDAWPVRRRPKWLTYVNGAEAEAEVAALRGCVKRGNPYGHEAWTVATAKALGLESSMRPYGRPRKPSEA